MALSFTTIANNIKTSIHGRRLGLDHDDCIAGPKHVKRQITEGTSSTQSGVASLANNGVVTLSGSNASTFALTDPYIGAELTLTNITTSVKTIIPAAATIISSNGIAGSTMTLTGIGAGFQMHGISTSQWLVTSKTASTAGTLVATVSS